MTRRMSIREAFAVAFDRRADYFNSLAVDKLNVKTSRAVAKKSFRGVINARYSNDELRVRYEEDIRTFLENNNKYAETLKRRRSYSVFNTIMDALHDRKMVNLQAKSEELAARRAKREEDRALQSSYSDIMSDATNSVRDAKRGDERSKVDKFADSVAGGAVNAFASEQKIVEKTNDRFARDIQDIQARLALLNAMSAKNGGPQYKLVPDGPAMDAPSEQPETKQSKKSEPKPEAAAETPETKQSKKSASEKDAPSESSDEKSVKKSASEQSDQSKAKQPKKSEPKPETVTSKSEDKPLKKSESAQSVSSEKSKPEPTEFVSEAPSKSRSGTPTLAIDNDEAFNAFFGMLAGGSNAKAAKSAVSSAKSAPEQSVSSDASMSAPSKAEHSKRRASLDPGVAGPAASESSRTESVTSNVPDFSELRDPDADTSKTFVAAPPIVVPGVDDQDDDEYDVDDDDAYEEV